MFPSSKRKQRPNPPSTGQQLFKRFIALGAGLLMLWVALTVMPEPHKKRQPVVFSAQSDAMAETGNTDSIGTSSTSLTPGLGKISAVLLLAGLMGFAWYRHKKSPAGQYKANALSSLGKIQLSPNQHVHLIHCGPDVLLVGATNNQISLLHTLPLSALPKQDENVEDVEQQGINTLNMPELKMPEYSQATATQMNNLDFGTQLQQHNYS